MNDTIKSWFLVGIQAILLLLLIFFTNSKTSTPHNLQLLGEIIKIIGIIVLAISFYDLRKSLTALPLPKDNGVLQVNGLYRYVRHPMYIGVLVFSLGICVASNSIEKYLLLLALYILFSYKSRYEEKLLLLKYPVSSYHFSGHSV